MKSRKPGKSDSGAPDPIGLATPQDSVVGSLLRYLALAIVVARSLYPSEDADKASGATIAFFEMLLLPMTCLFVLAKSYANRRLPRCSTQTGWMFLIWACFLAMVWVSADNASYRWPAKLIAWEWTAAASVALSLYFLGREGLVRDTVLTLCVVGLGQALVAFWQIAVEMPNLRREFVAGSVELRRQAREMGITGPVAEMLFKNRLDSNEPFGSFGHPNSLAGLLLLAAVTGTGDLLRFLVSSRKRWQAIPSYLSLGVMMLALVLTKSRSAWVGFVVGALILAASSQSLSRAGNQLARRLLFFLFGIACVIGILVWSKLLDVEVITESAKSLRYRFEWWQATVKVIEDSPLLGVGWGNFTNHYLVHKLPFSSEEIKDPHQFILELWACSGPATVLFYVMAAGVFCLALRSRPQISGEVAPSLFWPTGVLMGLSFVAVAEFPGWVGWTGLYFHLGAAGFLWITRGERLHWASEANTLFAGLLALHIHWLSAGGIAYPAMMLWTSALIAAWLGERDARWLAQLPRHPRSMFVQITRVIWLVVLLVLCSVGAGWYFLQVPQPLRTREALLLKQSRVGAQVSSPYNEEWASVIDESEAWVRLAHAHAERMSKKDARRTEFPEQAYQSAVQAIEKGLEIEPDSSGLWRQLAEIHVLADRLGKKEGTLEQAAMAFREAVGRYPNSASLRYELGEVLVRSGHDREAREEFERALELDRTPHPDKKLAPQQRQRASDFVGKHQ